MKLITIFILSLYCLTSFGTEIDRRPVSEITEEADHIFIGKITKIDFKDEGGQILNKGRTEPHCSAEIRAHIQVDQSQILKGNSQKIPNSLIVPFWNRFHFEASDLKILEGKSFVFCLKGESFERVYPLQWFNELSLKVREILDS